MNSSCSSLLSPSPRGWSGVGGGSPSPQRYWSGGAQWGRTLTEQEVTVSGPGRCVWSFLNHPMLSGLSLGRNIARTGEETSEITVKYLKILGRKMLWYKSKSFLISVLIMQTSFSSSSYKVFYHLSWRSHCSLVSTGEMTLLATLLSTCSCPGTMQRPKDTAAMTDTILQAGLYI